MSAGTIAATSGVASVDPSLNFVEANGIRFGYLEQGTGPLVMFMHGFPDNAWSYRHQMRVFADAGYRAVAPFLRGYAPTGFPKDELYDPVVLGQDLEALIAALSDDGKAAVIGMDWGGTSILQVLGTAPSTVTAAIVMNTAHPVTFLSIRKDPEAVHSIFHFYFFQLAGVDKVVDIEGLPFIDYLWKLWSPTFRNDEHLASIKQTLRSPGTMKAALAYYRGLFESGAAGRLPMGEMATPTLTIYGANDPTSRYSDKEEPLFTGPHRRIVLADVGHFPHLEREEEVTGMMLDWIRVHSPVANA